jgi:hypothetical protein
MTSSLKFRFMSVIEGCMLPTLNKVAIMTGVSKMVKDLGGRLQNRELAPCRDRDL